MMLIKLALATVSTIFATSLVAAPMSKSLDANDEPNFDTIAEFDANIPSGVSTWVVSFDEEKSGGDLSIWHGDTFSCRGFGIVKVRAKAPGEEGIWSDLPANLYRGVAHFKALESFEKIELTLSNELLRNARCQVQLRKANFEVPQLITMLAKLEAPTCLPDDNDGEAPSTCTHTITRLDLDTRDIITLIESQVERLRLVVGGIYKLRGYVRTLDDGTTVFDIQRADRVM